jgi:hypothetical protein
MQSISTSYSLSLPCVVSAEWSQWVSSSTVKFASWAVTHRNTLKQRQKTDGQPNKHRHTDRQTNGRTDRGMDGILYYTLAEAAGPGEGRRGVARARPMHASRVFLYGWKVHAMHIKRDLPLSHIKQSVGILWVIKTWNEP